MASDFDVLIFIKAPSHLATNYPRASFRSLFDDAIRTKNPQVPKPDTIYTLLHVEIL